MLRILYSFLFRNICLFLPLSHWNICLCENWKQMKIFLINIEYHPPTWKMLIIQALNINKARVFGYFHARTARSYSVFWTWLPAVWFGQNDLWSHLSLLHTVSDSLQGRSSPCPWSQRSGQGSGKGGTTRAKPSDSLEMKTLPRARRGPYCPHSWAACHDYSPSRILLPPWKEACLSGASRISTNCFLV